MHDPPAHVWAIIIAGPTAIAAAIPGTAPGRASAAKDLCRQIEKGDQDG